MIQEARTIQQEPQWGGSECPAELEREIHCNEDLLLLLRITIITTMTTITFFTLITVITSITIITNITIDYHHNNIIIRTRAPWTAASATGSRWAGARKRAEAAPY